MMTVLGFLLNHKEKITMVEKSSITRRDFPTMLGFDSFWDEFDRQVGKGPSFPKYNIIKENNITYIEIAVAGIPKEDLSIILENNVLSVAHDKKEKKWMEMSEEKEGFEVIHKGISERSFKLSFKISDTIEVKNAFLKDGMLKIKLESLIPEEKEPRQIEIQKES